jgi:hypothetical protein
MATCPAPTQKLILAKNQFPSSGVTSSGGSELEIAAYASAVMLSASIGATEGWMIICTASQLQTYPVFTLQAGHVPYQSQSMRNSTHPDFSPKKQKLACVGHQVAGSKERDGHHGHLCLYAQAIRVAGRRCLWAADCIP